VKPTKGNWKREPTGTLSDFEVRVSRQANNECEGSIISNRWLSSLPTMTANHRNDGFHLTMMTLPRSYLLSVLIALAVRVNHGFTAPASVMSPFISQGSPTVFVRNALLDPMIMDPSSLMISDVTDLSSLEIQEAFSVATFFPQPFWLLLVLLPKWDVTKKIMGGYGVVTLCCLVHFFIVSASIVQPGATAPLQEFSGVFDPFGNPEKAMLGMMTYPNFVSEEWSHVLSWDLFVGRWIWLDGLRRGVFTSHSVLLCNLIGPPGLLLHWATCLLTGKALPGNEANDDETQ
jgi:hypothetical protein